MASGDVTQFWRGMKKEQRLIARALHKSLLSIQPNYSVKLAWNGIGYKFGNNYSCLVAGYRDHVKLMIWLGVDLDDPQDKLRGAGSNTQHLVFKRKRDIDELYLKKLLRQQFTLFKQGVGYERGKGVLRDKKLSKVTQRVRYRMPKYMRDALRHHRLEDLYRERPPYQRNDYIGWITGAKREATREKRLNQMLDELEMGDVYMGMEWHGKK